MRLLSALVLACFSIAANAAGPVAETLPSGVTVERYREGAGASPTLTDVVRVHYQGTLTNGREFDSSYSRGQPAEFPVNGVIPCWTEVLQRMKPGEAVRISCPPQTAYGQRGIPGTIPPNSTLNFAVELLEVKR
ncbi:FKBP-type peptidyl-prolyl cis-trans isomerase [Aromatoleum toluclasticum]|uniref:FKBP-type peptidyl-prolyl cis-trans isomerase n=1 Tax=Aromatoleum toluclasticum TaxID=92003 RepID=UPI001D17E3DC|nr:FKBP-type peptidyl-prolyl cis-trans isomerase [Aromatoleum toluclasticum]MCC4118594.1 FKBP-type peptidyl-prolyl cis-trans isomerase [Aromatoleum toluclasticum]